MPVVGPGQASNGVTSSCADDGAVTGADQCRSLKYVQGLAVRVNVPVCVLRARSGRCLPRGRTARGRMA
jgi:hypothetical protein